MTKLATTEYWPDRIAVEPVRRYDSTTDTLGPVEVVPADPKLHTIYNVVQGSW